MDLAFVKSICTKMKRSEGLLVLKIPVSTAEWYTGTEISLSGSLCYLNQDCIMLVWSEWIAYAEWNFSRKWGWAVKPVKFEDSLPAWLY